MKAVIVDIQGAYAAALCENGSIEKIPDEHYEIGRKIEMPAAEKPAASKKLHGMSRTVRSLGTIAAVFALVVCTVSGIAYAMPYGTVSLDADASIEYTINCFNYVIDVKALNDDGSAVLDSMDDGLLLNKKIDSAVSATLEKESACGEADDETELVISVGTRGQAHSERLAGRLNDMMEHDTSVPAQVIPVTMDDVEAAHKDDMTAGRRWMQDNAAQEEGRDPGAKPDTAAPDAGTAPTGGNTDANAAGSTPGSTQNTGAIPEIGSRPAWQNGSMPAGMSGTDAANSTGTPNGTGTPNSTGTPNGTGTPNSNGTPSSGAAQTGTGAAADQSEKDIPQTAETDPGAANAAAGPATGDSAAVPEAPAAGNAAEDHGMPQPAAGAAEMPPSQENAEPMAESQPAPN